MALAELRERLVEAIFPKERLIRYAKTLFATREGSIYVNIYDERTLPLLIDLADAGYLHQYPISSGVMLNGYEFELTERGREMIKRLEKDEDKDLQAALKI